MLFYVVVLHERASNCVNFYIFCHFNDLKNEDRTEAIFFATAGNAELHLRSQTKRQKKSSKKAICSKKCDMKHNGKFILMLFVMLNCLPLQHRLDE
jgi:hypothetical protein